MKFKDLVFLAEMNYSDIPGDVSHNVRDASMGDEPPSGKDVPPMGEKRKWDYSTEFDLGDQGFYFINADFDYRDEAVDSLPTRYGISRDVMANVPYRIREYQVIKVDENENEQEVTDREEKQKLGKMAFDKAMNDEDFYYRKA